MALRFESVLVWGLVVILAAGCAPASLEGVIRGGAVGPPTSRDQVTIVRRGVTLADVPRLLKAGDRVSTGSETMVVLRFENETMVILQPNSTVVIGSLRDLVGEILVWAHARFQAHTEYVTAAVEGTKFSLTSRAGSALLAVAKGRVRLESNQGGWEAIRVGEGQSASVHGSGPPETRVLSEDGKSQLDRAFQRFDALIPQ